MTKGGVHPEQVDQREAKRSHNSIHIWWPFFRALAFSLTMSLTRNVISDAIFSRSLPSLARCAKPGLRITMFMRRRFVIMNCRRVQTISGVHSAASAFGSDQIVARPWRSLITPNVSEARRNVMGDIDRFSAARSTAALSLPPSARNSRKNAVA